MGVVYQIIIKSLNEFLRILLKGSNHCNFHKEIATMMDIYIDVCHDDL